MTSSREQLQETTESIEPRIRELLDLSLDALQRDPDHSLKLSEEAQALSKALPETETARVLRLRCRVGRTRALLQLHRTEEAHAEARLAIAACDHGTPGTHVAQAHGLLGRALELRGEIDASLAAHETALEALDTEERRTTTTGAWVQNGIGRLHFARGDYALAVDRFRRAQGAATACGDRVVEAVSLMNEGNALSQIGDLEGSLRAYEACLSIYRELMSHEGMVHALNNLAVVFLRQNEIEKSLSTCDECLSLPLDRPVPSLLSFTHRTKAGCLLKLRRHEEAIAEARRALESAEASDAFSRAEAYLILGQISKATGKTDQALEYLTSCSATMKDDPRFATSTRCRLEIAHVLSTQGRLA